MIVTHSGLFIELDAQAAGPAVLETIVFDLEESPEEPEPPALPPQRTMTGIGS
jgi:hypothetical protein